jgi:putative FmdB family regulatory protein
MPLYEYQCTACQAAFELLIRRPDESALGKITCPHCNSKKVEKQLSVTAAPSISSSSLPVCGSPLPSGGCGLPQCGTGGCQFGN